MDLSMQLTQLGELPTVKLSFIERWERDLEESTNPTVAWEADVDADPLAPHSTAVIPPLGYTDFIKEGLKEAGLLPTTLPPPIYQHQMPDAYMLKAPAAAGAPPTPQQDVARKELHNATEKRRREKINGKLSELREAIPMAGAAGANKTAVLRATVEHIRALNTQYSQLVSMNRSLQETNTHLLGELREMHRLLWARARDSLQQRQVGMPQMHYPPPPPGVLQQMQQHAQQMQQQQMQLERSMALVQANANATAMQLALGQQRMALGDAQQEASQPRARGARSARSSKAAKASPTSSSTVQTVPAAASDPPPPEDGDSEGEDL